MRRSEPIVARSTAGLASLLRAGRHQNQPPSKRPVPSPVSGYTLIELLVTLSLIAIVTAIAVPSFDARRMQINAAYRLVIAQLRGARSNAITRSTHFTVAFPMADRLVVERMQQVGGVWIVDSGDVRTITLPSATQLASSVVGTSVEFNSRGVAVSLAAPRQIDVVDVFGVTKSLQAWPSGQVNDL